MARKKKKKQILLKVKSQPSRNLSLPSFAPGLCRIATRHGKAKKINGFRRPRFLLFGGGIHLSLFFSFPVPFFFLFFFNSPCVAMVTPGRHTGTAPKQSSRPVCCLP